MVSTIPGLDWHWRVFCIVFGQTQYPKNGPYASGWPKSLLTVHYGFDSRSYHVY